MDVVKQLAEQICAGTFDKLPEAVRQQALRCMADAVTAAVTGYSSEAASACRAAAATLFAGGVSPLWLAGCSLGPVGAAFANSAAMSALDFDDGHRRARGHPGAAVIPSALAAFANGGEAEDLIAGVVAGYEISIRIAAAQNPASIKTRQSGRWTGFGAIAAAALIGRSPANVTASAMAIAGCWSPNQEANGSSGYARQTGNHAKEGIPWSVVTGLTSLELAQRGFTGPGDLLDHAAYYDPAKVLEGLGERWDILGIYFKPYSCCRYIHPAIDAALRLLEDHRIRLGDIETIQVRTFEWANRLQNSYEPSNLVEIQYSLPFCVAAALCKGAHSLSPIDERLLHDPDVRRLAARVDLVSDPDLDRRFPAETLAQVNIQTPNGSAASDIVSPRGDAGDPLTWDGLLEKFRISTARLLEEDCQLEFLVGFESLKAGDPQPLIACLKKPMRAGGS
ncbi:MAG TPA: MmgE/PrpD family protein [Pseudorhizobium sp.]|nr:MmgE/PrpD family protein [Pseudorhizobium sp.]